MAIVALESNVTPVAVAYGTFATSKAHAYRDDFTEGKGAKEAVTFQLQHGYLQEQKYLGHLGIEIS